MGLTSCAYNVDVEYERGFLDKERPELTHQMLFPFWDKEKAIEQLNAISRHSKVVKVELIYDGEVIMSRQKK